MTQQVDRDNEAEALTRLLGFYPDPNHPEKTKTASKSFRIIEPSEGYNRPSYDYSADRGGEI